jgi:phenolic acid decarboxylase
MAENATHEKGNIVEQYLKDRTWVDTPEVLPWYTKDLVDLHPKTKELFETYSKVPPDDVVSHITQIRNKAFKIVGLQSQ